jgi:hypothetical protein
MEYPSHLLPSDKQWGLKMWNLQVDVLFTSPVTSGQGKLKSGTECLWHRLDIFVFISPHTLTFTKLCHVFGTVVLRDWIFATLNFGYIRSACCATAAVLYRLDIKTIEFIPKFQNGFIRVQVNIPDQCFSTATFPHMFYTAALCNKSRARTLCSWLSSTSHTSTHLACIAPTLL